MSTRRTVLLAAGLLAIAAACTPTSSTGAPVPSAFPPCVDSPTCLVVSNPTDAANTPAPVAISDDGRVMATVLSTSVGGGEYRSTLALVGIEDRWYRTVAATVAPGIIDGYDIAMTPNAQRLVFAAQGELASPSLPPDADPLPDTSDLYVYNGSTKQVTRPAQPAAVTRPEVSSDGRFVAAQSNEGVVVLDVVANTYEVVGANPGYDPDISADGHFVVWGNREPEPGSHPGYLTRYDRSEGSSVSLGAGGQPSISGDGSRVAAHGNLQGFGQSEWIRYIDVGDPDWTTVVQGDSGGFGGPPWLSTDGQHLVYRFDYSLLNGRLYDKNLGTGATGDFGPLSIGMAVSANGNHIVYNNPLGYFRWSRP